MTRNRLELTWVDKHKRSAIEPRLLIDDPELSYHASRRVHAEDQFENVLIQGDNRSQTSARFQRLLNALAELLNTPLDFREFEQGALAQLIRTGPSQS